MLSSGFTINFSKHEICIKQIFCLKLRSCGPMAKARLYGSRDSRFDPWQDQVFI